MSPSVARGRPSRSPVARYTYTLKPDICLMRGYAQSDFDSGTDERDRPLHEWPEPTANGTIMCLEVTFTTGKTLHQAIYAKQFKYTPLESDRRLGPRPSPCRCARRRTCSTRSEREAREELSWASGTLAARGHSVATRWFTECRRSASGPSTAESRPSSGEARPRVPGRVPAARPESLRVPAAAWPAD